MNERIAGQARHLILAFVLLSGLTTPLLAQDPPMVINRGVDGSWFKPATAGQGFLFETVPSSNTLVAYWFTYTLEGDGPAWYIATGDISGPAAEMTIYVVSGGKFDDPTEVTEDIWGSGQLLFSKCLDAVWNYRNMAGDLEGSINLTRLTPDLTCESSLAEAQTTFVSAGNSWLDAQGIWFFSGCVQTGDNSSHGDELFVISDDVLAFDINTYDTPDCTGDLTVDSRSFRIGRVDKSMADLDGEQVISNRVIMTDLQSQETVKQIFYVSDDGPQDMMTHGNFDSAPDADGFPSAFETLMFIR